MAGSVNKVILIGALGRDPEIRTFQNGGRVANLSLATSERWTDKNSGEKRERTEWHRVAIMNENLIGVAEKYLRKGSKVYLEGQMETRSYEKNGEKRYQTEVVLRPFRSELTLLDSKSDGQGGGNPYDDGRAWGNEGAPSSGGAGGGPPDDMDDSIPF